MGKQNDTGNPSQKNIKQHSPENVEQYAERQIQTILNSQDEEQKNFSLLMSTQAYQRIYGPGASSNPNHLPTYSRSYYRSDRTYPFFR